MKRTQTLLLAALIAGACLFGGCNLGDGSNCDCPKFGQTNQQLDNQLALATHSLE